ncbi:MAG TPA: F0F1 ATP synthase subunit B [Candidatus Scalindua sp.]|nr:F0F1 ATP synthase subunit B [Candidatus Scalindua sp.]
MPQFDLHFLAPLTFWSIISFLILMVILYKYALPAITGILDARQEKIKGDIDQAEKLRGDAEKLKGEYQKKVIKAEEEAEGKIQAAVVKAKEISDGIVKEGNQAAADNRAKAQLGIDIERKKALAELRNQVVDLTILSSSKLIQQSMQRKTAESLVDDVIKGVGKLS